MKNNNENYLKKQGLSLVIMILAGLMFPSAFLGEGTVNVNPLGALFLGLILLISMKLLGTFTEFKHDKQGTFS